MTASGAGGQWAPRAGRNEPGGSPAAEQLATIDQYISSFPEDVQVILEALSRRPAALFGK